jgi:hypothetical protein
VFFEADERQSKKHEAANKTATFRVASKGVYADGGSITERWLLCKFVARPAASKPQSALLL